MNFPEASLHCSLMLHGIVPTIIHQFQCLAFNLILALTLELFTSMPRTSLSLQGVLLPPRHLLSRVNQRSNPTKKLTEYHQSWSEKVTAFGHIRYHLTVAILNQP